MLYNPRNMIKKEGTYVFGGKVNAVAHPVLQKPIFGEFWQGFSYRLSTLSLTPCEGFIFRVGEAEALPLDGYDYTVNVTSDGICLQAKSERELIYAYMALIDRITATDGEGDTSLAIDACEIYEKPLIDRRMAHFCIFPETSLFELQRFLRMCGALRYTHVILEFWGMFCYDCMKELAWETAFTREELVPILSEARDLGLELIPMFNHWGHASASRVLYGKHVALDQNPSLQSYFSDNGWCWVIEKPKVRALLREVRRELCALCGEGSYFHIGCDEAYGFDLTKQENALLITDFLNEIADEMKACGRRVIVWGDMFIAHRDTHRAGERYTCNAPYPETEDFLLSRLSRDVLIADWQYDAKTAPVETVFSFKAAGFDCLLCPWDRGMAQMRACLDTVKGEKLFGLLHTTWHTFDRGHYFLLMAAVGCFEGETHRIQTHYLTQSATLARKVMFVDGDYEKAGFAKKQITQVLH